MSRYYTVQEIIERAQRKAEMPTGSSDYVILQEWIDYLNEGSTELLELIYASSADFNVTGTTLVANGVSSSYSLPDDYLQMRWIDCVNGTQRGRVQRFTTPNRNTYRNSNGLFGSGNGYGTGYVYRTQGNSSIQIYPTPPSGETFEINYAPRGTIYTTGSLATQIDGINGWESYIVVATALNALIKEGIEFEKINLLKSQKNEQLKRIIDQVTKLENDGTDKMTWIQPENYFGRKWWI